MEDVSIRALLNDGIAVGVAWYVLTRLNATLKELSAVINRLNEDLDKRLDKVEAEIRDLRKEFNL